MTFYVYIILACLLLAALVCRVVTIWGAARMLQGKSYGMGVTSSILAMIPCSPLWLISLPMGLWSLAVLTRRDVKAGFADQRWEGEEDAKDSGTERSAQESAVQGPAIGLVITGVLNWIALPMGFAVFAYLTVGQPQAVPRAALAALAAAGFLFSGLILFAAFKMKRLEAYPLAIIGSLLAMIVSPGNVIGFPIGIWALVVLSQKEIREAFAAGRRREHDDDQTGAGPAAGQRIVQGPADALIVVAGAALLTGIGVALWLWQALLGWDPTASRFSTQGQLQFTLLGMSITHVIYAAFIAIAGILMRRLRARLFVLLCVVLVGVLLPATLALNVIMELEHIPVWPVLIPMWLGLPFAVWAAVVLFRQDVRAAFVQQGKASAVSVGSSETAGNPATL